jgi:hypothetical protein
VPLSSRSAGIRSGILSRQGTSDRSNWTHVARRRPIRRRASVFTCSGKRLTPLRRINIATTTPLQLSHEYNVDRKTQLRQRRRTWTAPRAFRTEGTTALRGRFTRRITPLWWLESDV